MRWSTQGQCRRLLLGHVSEAPRHQGHRRVRLPRRLPAGTVPAGLIRNRRRASAEGKAMSTPLLKLTGISKRFGAVRALTGVSFELARRRGACADGRERRRQVDADEHRRRRAAARRRRDRDRGQGGQDRRPGGGARRGHRPGAPGDRALPGHLGRREHLHGRDQRQARPVDGHQEPAPARRGGAGRPAPGAGDGAGGRRCRSPASRSSRSPRR